MSLRSRHRHDGRPPECQEYQRSFLQHVHHLVGRGFEGISHLELSTRDETAITGLLTKSIEDFCDHRDSPAWTDRYFIQDERHLSDSDREGKRRLRVDIELVSSYSRPRPRFQIEAKRLKDPKTHSLNEYLGVDGLGSFLSERYAKDQPWAGMLGYVQCATTIRWAELVGSAIMSRANELALASETRGLHLTELDGLLPAVYRSDHTRQTSQPIQVHHILLPCCDEPAEP